MPRTGFVAGSVLLLAIAAACSRPEPLHLLYSSRMEMTPTTVQGQSDPVLEAIGKTASQMVLPGGAVVLTTLVGEHGIRLEWDKALPGIPAGAAMIYNAQDGSSVIVDPAQKNFWRVSPDAVTALLPPGVKPQVTTRKTGEKLTMLGVPTERMTFEIRLPLPGPAGQPRPAGMPAEVTMSGEAWVAEKYKPYLAGAAAQLSAMSALGMESLGQEGLQMKQILRSPVFGAQQLETTVTTIAEERVAADRFKVPAGFTEVIAPGGGS